MVRRVGRRSGILTKFFIAFLLIGVTAVVLSGLQMYIGAREIIISTKLANLASIRNTKAQQVETFLSSLKNPVATLSSSPLVSAAERDFSYAFAKVASGVSEETAARCDAALEASYARYVAASPETSTLFSFPPALPSSANARILQCAYWEQDPAFPAEVRSEVLSSRSVAAYGQVLSTYREAMADFKRRWKFYDILLVNPQGRIVYSYAMNSNVGRIVYDDQWKDSTLRQAFDFAMNSKDHRAVKFFDFSFYRSSGGKPMMLVSSAVDGGEKGNAGAFVVVMDSGQLNRLLSGGYMWSREGLGETGEAYVIGGDGFMRSDPRKFIEDPDSYFGMFSDTPEESRKASLALQWDTTVLLRRVHSLLADNISSGVPGVYRGPNYAGVTSIIAYAPVNAADLDWGVVVRMNSAEAERDAATLRNIFWNSALQVTIIIVFLTLLLSYFFTRPIKKLGESLSRVADGDLDHRAEIVSRDELGDLASSFNYMVESLKKRSDEKEEAVRKLDGEIRERIAAERKLMEERDFASTVFNSKGIMVLVVDENDVVVRANDSAIDVFNIYGKEVLGSTVNEIVPKKYLRRVREAIETARSGAGPKSVFAKDNYLGRSRYIDWTISLISDERSGRSHIVTMGVDVTERFKMLATIKENNVVLQAVTSHAQDGVIISDGEGRVVMWNESAAQMFDYSFEEIKDKPLVPTVIPLEYESEFRKGGRSGVTLEIYALKKRGERFPAEISLSQVKVRGARHSLYIVRDVSSRKKREIELYKALDKAEVAEKAKSEFLANMSHEIRTPLNGIIGFLGLLKQTPLDRTQIEYLNIINVSAESLLSIINEILDFSKIESGKMVLESVEFDAYHELEQAAELYSAKADEKNINLVVAIDPDMPAVLSGDPLRLRQILSNLLSNAVKFTGPGGCVTLSAVVLENSGGACRMRFAVKDTGIGISAEKQASIFEAFSQGDSSVTRRYGGSGLGLAICSRLTKLLGSGMKLVSEEGKGSEFSFVASFPVGKSGRFSRPDFGGAVVAVYAGSQGECVASRSLPRYVRALGCKTFFFASPEELDEKTSVSAAIVDYDEAGIETLRRLAENGNLFKAVSVAGTKRSELSEFEGRPDFRLILKPVNMSKLASVFEIFFGSAEKKDASAPDFSNDMGDFSGRVLVAEDNAINRKLAYIMLRNAGLEVDLAENGREACEMARANVYDIIFMDIHMPVMDGVTAAKRIIESELEEGRPHVPIVALTANVVKESQEHYKSAGMDAFLPKPVEAGRLREILVAYLALGASGEYDGEKNTDFRDRTVYDNIKASLGFENQGVLKNVVDEYYNMSLAQADAVIIALMSSDVEGAAAVARRLAGFSRNLSLDGIAALAEKSAAAAENGDVREAERILEDVRKELERIKKLAG